MAGKDIDSFLLKFKTLLYSGKNASLTIQSEAGKANVSLTVSLDHISSDLPPPPPNEYRSCPPTRVRRRARRDEDRRWAAEEAVRIAAPTTEEPASIDEESTSDKYIVDINVEAEEALLKDNHTVEFIETKNVSETIIVYTHLSGR